MAWRVDTKSVALGVVLGAGLIVLVGAVRNEPAGQVGRYRVSCSQSNAYLVDTTTGQIWLNSEREFRMPKLKPETAAEKPAVETPAARNPVLQSPTVQVPVAQSPARTPAVETPKPARRPTGFVGKWVLKHPTAGEFSILIQPDGKAVLATGRDSSEGKWEQQGNQITITTDRESITAQLDDQGRLMVKQGDSEPIAFQWAE
ncbi:MAG: hypothetical protein GX448_14885 [Planctomycetes bacterium]|nr:hypothetical protein [Planctomycetota bacterium]